MKMGDAGKKKPRNESGVLSRIWSGAWGLGNDILSHKKMQYHLRWWA